MRTFSAWLALAFGTFLAIAELGRNWDYVQWWPFWVVDYIAAGLLVWGAAGMLWTPAKSRSLALAAAWGFTTSMFYMSLFSHLSAFYGDDAATARIVNPGVEETRLTMIIGFMFLLTVVGLITSLWPRARHIEVVQVAAAKVVQPETKPVEA